MYTTVTCNTVTYVVFVESGIQCAEVEVESLVDDGAGLDVRGVKILVLLFAVLGHEVLTDGARLPQRETLVDDDRHGMLRVDLKSITADLVRIYLLLCQVVDLIMNGKCQSIGMGRK